MIVQGANCKGPLISLQAEVVSLSGASDQFI